MVAEISICWCVNADKDIFVDLSLNVLHQHVFLLQEPCLNFLLNSPIISQRLPKSHTSELDHPSEKHHKIT